MSCEYLKCTMNFSRTFRHQVTAVVEIKVPGEQISFQGEALCLVPSCLNSWGFLAYLSGVLSTDRFKFT